MTKQYASNKTDNQAVFILNVFIENESHVRVDTDQSLIFNTSKQSTTT